MGLLDNLLGSETAGQNSDGSIAGALLGLLASERGRATGSETAGASDPSANQSAGAVSGGLSELVQRFQRSGLGDVIQSWIGSGPNQPVAPDDLHQAIGPESIDRLSRQTGLGRSELLALVAQALPMIVDRLTPSGRVPQEPEVARMQSNQSIDV